MNELVLKHRPAVVVYYCGTNDISAGANAEDTAAGFAEFVRRWVLLRWCISLLLEDGLDY